MRIGPVLWRYCHVLRHDGMDYGQYLDQITFLLFLKMWEDAQASLWSSLARSSTTNVLSTYTEILQSLGARSDQVGSIFSGARNEFASGAALMRLVNLIDELKWEDLDQDVQAEAFEYLLERAAAEGKKGAGQYFTPRPLMRTIVDCIQPGGVSTDALVGDPAAGTGGFLVAASEWAGGNVLDPSRVSYWGGELVQRPRRLALMNAMLHRLNNARVDLGDALAEPMAVSPDVVLANPPFGSQGGRIPNRPDFWFRTTNKQANFLQHIVVGLREHGRAAVVVPDNCLFGDIAKGVLPGLLERADLHTILRLPEGTFAPYTSGTRTNVLFFNRDRPTTQVWIYDARTGNGHGEMSPIQSSLEEFTLCFGTSPVNIASRSPRDSPSGRWRVFGMGDVRRLGHEIDRLPWRANAGVNTAADRLQPLRDARAEMQAALREINELLGSIESR